MTPMARQAADRTAGASSLEAASITADKMYSCFNVGNPQKTAAVKPAKHVSAAPRTIGAECCNTCGRKCSKVSNHCWHPSAASIIWSPCELLDLL
jgi:hypothetical protein